MQSDTATKKRRAAEVARLARLVERFHGNRSAIARAMSRGGFTITRQGVTGKLERAGLLAEADRLSHLALKPGQRTNLDGDELDLERAALVDALAGVEHYGDAIEDNGGPLAYSIATLWRKISAYQVTREEVAEERARRAR